MIKKLCMAISLLIISSAGVLSAQEDSLPDYTGYINDFAEILAPDVKAMMSSIAQQIEVKTTAQMALVTLPTVRPLSIEQYAVALFEKWGIGQKGKDNGVLILMAVNDKQVRIETGYGLEGALPDAICNQIIYRVMIPEFKKGDPGKGLLSGMIAVAELVAREYNIELTLNEAFPRLSDSVSATPRGVTLFRLLAYLALFIFMFGLRSGLLWFWILGPTGRRRGGYWYGSGFGGGSGGFGGGFGGFGGGLSGGGGASGSW